MVESVEDALVPGLCVLYFVFKKVPSYIFFVFCTKKGTFVPDPDLVILKKISLLPDLGF